jgi:hypothetical protein
MKINKKLYFRLVYFMAGTIIIGIMFLIVAFNFAKDSRLLHSARWPSQVEEQQSSSTTAKDASGYDTVTYERSTEAADTSTTNQKTTKQDNGTTSKVKLQIINRSTSKSLTEELRSTFEAGGFVVSAGNEQTNSTESTIIIEWNGSKAGEKVQKILKTGKIVKQNDSGSRFDVTVIVGDDFRP